MNRPESAQSSRPRNLSPFYVRSTSDSPKPCIGCNVRQLNIRAATILSTEPNTVWRWKQSETCVVVRGLRWKRAAMHLNPLRGSSVTSDVEADLVRTPGTGCAPGIVSVHSDVMAKERLRVRFQIDVSLGRNCLCLRSSFLFHNPNLVRRQNCYFRGPGFNELRGALRHPF